MDRILYFIFTIILYVLYTQSLNYSNLLLQMKSGRQQIIIYRFFHQNEKCIIYK